MRLPSWSRPSSSIPIWRSFIALGDHWRTKGGSARQSLLLRRRSSSVRTTRSAWAFYSYRGTGASAAGDRSRAEEWAQKASRVPNLTTGVGPIEVSALGQFAARRRTAERHCRAGAAQAEFSCSFAREPSHVKNPEPLRATFRVCAAPGIKE